MTKPKTILAQFAIIGRPVSQKNSKQIRRRGRGGSPFVSSNDRVKDWHVHALIQLHAQKAEHDWFDPKPPPIPKTHPVAIELQAYCGKGLMPDVDNIAAAPMDALQTAGILENDSCVADLRVVRHKDGSEPRIEITIFEIGD